MNDSDRMQTVDRRGDAAGQALQAAVRDVVPPTLPVNRGRPAARWAPLLVAAALVVAALVAAAFLAVPSDEGTLAGEGDRTSTVTGNTRVVVDDPEAVGVTVRAASRGTGSGSGDVTHFGAAAVHVPDGDWGRAVVVTTSDFEPFAFTGVVVDVNGPDAVLAAHDPGGVLWRDGTRMHRVSSGSLDDDKLAGVVADAVADGWRGDGPLPGHRVALEGNGADFRPAFDQGLLPEGGGAVAYDMDDGTEFVVSWQPGSEARWRAEQVDGRNRRDVQVGDKKAVAAEYGDGPTLRVASWVEPDGTIVRVGTHGNLDQVLESVGGRLTSADAATFDRLVADHPPDETHGMFRYEHLGLESDPLDPDDPWRTADGGRVLADVSVERGFMTFRVAVAEKRDGSTVMHQFTLTNSGSGGGGSGSIQLGRPLIQAADATTTGPPDAVRMVGGVVPADWTVERVLDRSTGTALAILDQADQRVDGEDSKVVVTVIAADGFDNRPLEVVFRSGDGTEVRYWA